MKNRRMRVIAWGLALVVTAANAARAVRWMTTFRGQPASFEPVDVFGWGLLLPLVFSILAALIISRQPGNRVGSLMMIISLSSGLSSVLDLVLLPYASTAPDPLTGGLWLAIYLSGTAWVPLIFPLFLIPLYFPTGHPPTPRWRWVAWLALGMAVTFYVLAALTAVFETPNWTVPNPIGIIPESFWEGGFMLIWTVGLLTTVAGSVASLYVRFRRAGGSERQQIRWLLLAGVVFLIIYASFAILTDAQLNNGFFDILFALSILGLPVAIAIAIFRYRLWDLEVVINRALVYGPLTTLLAGTFAMGIAVTTEITKQTLGEESRALGAAISAVTVAVVFQPLRSWIEKAVDRRFYPQKLDMASGLVEVEPAYWGFLDRDMLIRLSMEHVRRVLGTEHAAFYLPASPERFELVGRVNDSGQTNPTITLSKKQHEELHKKRVVASEGMAPMVGHVPVFVDRGKSNELLGLLSVGRRTNGKGYSGDDLKGLVEMGGKIGLALNAVRLGREKMGSSDSSS